MEYWSLEKMMAFGKLLSEKQEGWSGFMDKKEVERKNLLRLLKNDDKYWARWADGYLSCPICGCLIHPSYKDTHIVWHERNNQ